MNTEDVVLKEIPRTRVAELSALAASYDGADIGPVLGPLYEEVWRRLGEAGVTATGTPIAYYVAEPEGTGDRRAVRVHAAVEVARDTSAGQDFQVVDLPGMASAATIVHHGSMDDASRSLQTLIRWVADNGFQPMGYAREVCLEYDPDRPENRVHELQLEVTRR